MARVLGIIIAMLVAVVPHLAAAQNGRQIFDFVLEQAERELQHQQQRELERQRRQELNRLHQQYVAEWRACFVDDLAACDSALAYPYMDPKDRPRLIAKRASIVAAQQADIDRAQQQRIDAELEEQRRLREQQELAERARAEELARQREEIERQRQRAERAERNRLAAEAQLANVRAVQARADEEQKRAAAELTAWSVLQAVAALLLLLALVFGSRLARWARTVQWRDLMQRLARPKPSGFSAPAALGAPQQPQDNAASESVSAHGTATTPEALPAVQPEKPRDTPAAIAALELAHAYIEEVRDAERPAFDDKETRRDHLNTLALATKQLAAAGKLDPDAVLEGENDGVPYRFTLNELKAEALLIEGLTHQVYDLKRALPALVAATEADPNNPSAFYALGVIHAVNYNKSAAVAAFQRAVALAPKNLDYRKELNRAESLSATEIAGYKAVRAGERIYDAGIKTANAGIMAWNVFAITWNIVTFPLRMLVAIFRFLRLAPFA